MWELQRLCFLHNWAFLVKRLQRSPIEDLQTWDQTFHLLHHHKELQLLISSNQQRHSWQLAQCWAENCSHTSFSYSETEQMGISPWRFRLVKAGGISPPVTHQPLVKNSHQVRQSIWTSPEHTGQGESPVDSSQLRAFSFTSYLLCKQIDTWQSWHTSLLRFNPTITLTQVIVRVGIHTCRLFQVLKLLLPKSRMHKCPLFANSSGNSCKNYTRSVHTSFLQSSSISTQHKMGKSSKIKCPTNRGRSAAHLKI
jgi:hypothetical protein